MFRRDKDRDRDRNREQKGFSPCGQVRVLVVGDSGVGKSSIVHFLVNGAPVHNIQQTVGCKVGIKLMTYGGSGSSSSTSSKGIIFVHDLSQRKTKSNLQKWATEIANLGTFSAPLGICNIAGIPVPFLVIGNKADIAPKDCGKGSSSNLVDAARQWVEKQGLLSPSEELPLSETFPGSGGLVTVAKEGRLDKEAVNKFFITLIKRRYYPEDLPVSVQQSWVSPTASKNIYHARQKSNDDNSMRNFIGLNGDDYRYNSLPPLPAQRTLIPPPTSYPQQPMLFSDDYSIPRFKASASSETTNVKSKRADILV